MRGRPWLFVLALGAIGCGAAPRPFYLNHPATRVVVLPPFVETMNPDAWKTLWPYLLEGVRERGYAVASRADVEAFYAKNNFRGDPAEIKLYKVEEIAKEFNADAVFYSNITQWGYKYVLVYSEFGVAAEYELVDGKSGESIWKGKSEAVERSGVQGRNAFELILSAVGVAGNAFLSSPDAAARECAARGIARFPLVGFDPAPPPSENPGTNEAAPKSDPKVSEEPPK